MPAPSRTKGLEHHEFIVVGAGILGLSAAWTLSRRGHDVLVLDADQPGHPDAGSRGTARIFRLSYPDPLYVLMAMAAQAGWRSLEMESGRDLLHLIGLISFGQDLSSLSEAMTRAGAPYAALSPHETSDRFPHLQINGASLFEESSGVLVADECLRALCDTGKFELRPHTGVRNLLQERNGATVALDDGARLSADVVINCAGHQSISLLNDVRVRVAAPPSLQQVVYLPAQEPDGNVPLFIEWGGDMIYGLPVAGRSVLKLSHHRPGPSVPDDGVELDDDPELLALLRRAADRLLPTFATAPTATERCVYDNTVDSDFIIDRVGHIVVGCGTSGHGFKFGPILGELLADLALGHPTSFSLDRFSLHRSYLRLVPNP